MEEVFEMQDASPDAQKKIEQGKFRLAVRSHPSTHQDQLVVIPEGNVQEQIAVKPTFSERYMAQFVHKAS
jgi:hypothetical protein